MIVLKLAGKVRRSVDFVFQSLEIENDGGVLLCFQELQQAIRIYCCRPVVAQWVSVNQFVVEDGLIQNHCCASLVVILHPERRNGARCDTENFHQKFGVAKRQVSFGL